MIYTTDSNGDRRVSIEKLLSSIATITGGLVALAVATGILDTTQAQATDEALKRIFDGLQHAWPDLVVIGALWYRWRSRQDHNAKVLQAATVEHYRKIRRVDSL